MRSDYFKHLWKKSRKESGVAMDCLANLQSNVKTFEDHRIDGSFTENKTEGSVEASHLEELLKFLVGIR